MNDGLNERTRKQTMYASGFKGIPQEDKQNEEEEVARIVLDYLGWPDDQLKSEPGGKDTPPDVATSYQTVVTLASRSPNLSMERCGANTQCVELPSKIRISVHTKH